LFHVELKASAAGVPVIFLFHIYARQPKNFLQIEFTILSNF